MATDGERPTRGGATSTAAADLFICFNSRSSSSSSLMKLPSKSLFSPARPGVDAGHGPAAASSTSSSSMLYTSLSRRLQSSGSLRGGGQASPMFPPAGSGKKKAPLEEPSSPKVTCIGQVRVKTRKQGKRMRAARTRSRRRSEGCSFRERERQRYWAALPISICEAVRALGAEFNCFQPCGAARSGCASSASPAAEREKADRESPARSYCGVVFARWLVALNEEGEKEVVSHVSPEVVAKVEEGRLERLGDATVVVDEEEEEGEYQVCVPPKNALLLMRCRSEPFRMASYTNRFWESPANPEMGRGEDEAEEEVEEEENGNATLCEVKAEIGEEVEEVEEKKGSEDVPDVQVKEEVSKVAIFVADESENTGRNSVCVEDDGEGIKLNEQEIELGEEEQASDHESPPSEAPNDDDGATDEKIQEETPSKAETSSESDEREEQEAIEEEKTTQLPQTHTLEEDGEESDDGEEDAQPAQIESSEKTEHIEEEDDEKVEEEVKPIAIFESEDAIGGEEEADMAAQEVPPPATAEEKVKEEEDGALPECLLLMLYEPKLSMEVSKETWVCSTDFFQWRPGKDRRPKLAGDTAVGGGVEGRRNSTDSRPSRPSGNRVAAVSAATAAAATSGRPSPPLSMATVVEEKLVKAAAYEPQVLTRCKSEPMRTSARLAPEACVWKSGRKMRQPPRRSLRADPVS